MKERGILFSGPMVRALLDSSKTQTRLIVKPAPTELIDHGAHVAAIIDKRPVYEADGTHSGGRFVNVHCPYGRPGDRLWVRETFAAILPQDPTYNDGEPIAYDYAATYKHGDRLGDSLGIKKRWTPSIFMPRAASRILLEIVSVRVERLNDISNADAIAEGIDRVGNNYGNGPAYCDYRAKNQEDTAEWFNSPLDSYRTLWKLINGPESWVANPWVWVIKFKRVTP